MGLWANRIIQKHTFLILFLFVLYSFTPIQATAYSPPLLLDMETFEYHVGDLPGVPDDNIVDPDSFEDWKPLSEFEFSELNNHHDVWLRISYPDSDWDEPALLFSAFLNNLDVYIGNTLIYTYKNISDEPDSDFRYHMSHVIPLEDIVPGMDIFLHSSYPSRAGLGEIYSLSIGETADMLATMISERDDVYKGSLRDVCLGFLLLVIGGGSFFIFLIRWRERSYPFFSFGMFSLFVGVTYLSDVNALFFLNLSPQTHFYLKSFSFLMVPSGLFAFFGTMFTLNRFYSRLVTGLWVFHSVLAVSAMILSTYDMDCTPCLLLVIILNCLICIRIIMKSPNAAAMNIRTTFIVFFLLFILLILVHFMERLNLIPYTYDVFGWGMVVFVFVLGYVMIQHYTSTFYTMQNVSLELEKNKSELLELQKENLISQLEALKCQVDPHFLFNSFSTLASIIEENQTTAVWFVQELSRVYRYVLQTRSSSLVTLKEELEFIASYSFLMSKRFGKNLSIHVSVPDSFSSYLVMPFSLQLLVENAIKHNIISKKKPLTISIFVQEGYLVVSNKLQKKALSGPSTHIGLDNITNRYRLISNKNVRIDETDSEFRVQIPMIENKGKNHECSDH